MSTGFFIIHRKFEDDWKWQKPLYRSAWVWMLSRAAWGETDGLKRGQLRFSVTWAKRAWGMSTTQARRFLKMCENEVDCTGNPTPSITWERGKGRKLFGYQNGDQVGDQIGDQVGVITIVNYNKYQIICKQVGDQIGDQSGYQNGYFLKEEEKEEENKRTSPPKTETPRDTKAVQLAKIKDTLDDYKLKFPWLDVANEFDTWQDWMLAKGKKFKNYAAAFRNWCSADWKKPKESEAPKTKDFDWDD